MPRNDQSAASAPPSIEPALRTIAMPADTNPDGDIFGGWLLAQMDLAGGNIATQRAHGRVVTIAIDGMTFYEPVEVGNELSCYAQITRIGRTSLTVQVQAWKRHRTGGAPIKVTEGVFTYVKIDATRRPQPVPSA